jgi:toxin ParE1/3/4
MALVNKTVRAETDLLDIWLYIARDHIVAADRLLDVVDEKCTLLATFPNMGRSRPELAAGIRSFAIGSYIVFYHVVDVGVEIVRVLSGFRDIDSVF